MWRLSFIACALIASATYAARPMVIHQSQTIEPPAGSGYYYFYDVAIDGDWAIILASTPSPTPSSPQQTHDAVLYHRVNGVWTLDRILIRRVSTQYGQYVGFASVAMNNGVAAIGSNPTRMFKRTNNTWNEITHPFTAPPGDPNHVAGPLLWDGTTLLATRPFCDGSAQGSWGALISRLNVDGSWAPLERLSSGATYCTQDPIHWGISGDTVVAGTYTYDYEVVPDQLRIFRRSGTTWIPTSAIDGGNGEGDVRGNEIFFSSGPPTTTLVYRNDDTQTVVDNIQNISAHHAYGHYAHNFKHTNDVFVQDRDLFRKNAAGKYEHVAMLVPTGGSYALIDEVAINGRRLISQAWRDYISSNQVALIFDLPATYTPSPVIASGFEIGPSPFDAQLGTFAVATTGNGNHVYRQSSLAGDYLALLGNSNWSEQSIQADIKPTAFSGSDRWAGLAVRYQDASNYYYVTLRSSGVVALKSIRNGVVSTMAERALPIVAGRSYHIAMVASAGGIRVTLDGLPLLSGPLPDSPQGSVALLGYRTAVDYDNVVAAQVGQRPIFDLSLANCFGPPSGNSVWTTRGTGNWNCSQDTPGVHVMEQTSTAGSAVALVGIPTTDDQLVKTRARATSFGSGADRWFGIAARYVDESNYYYLTVRNSNTVSLRKVVNGTITVLGTASRTVAPNTWYDLRLDAVGSELRAFVNGVQVLQAVDTSHASGQGGILTYKTAAEYMDYLAWQP